MRVITEIDDGAGDGVVGQRDRGHRPLPRAAGPRRGARRPPRVVLDGEVIALDPATGRPDFGRLQPRMQAGIARRGRPGVGRDSRQLRGVRRARARRPLAARPRATTSAEPPARGHGRAPGPAGSSPPPQADGQAPAGRGAGPGPRRAWWPSAATAGTSPGGARRLGEGQGPPPPGARGRRLAARARAPARRRSARCSSATTTRRPRPTTPGRPAALRGAGRHRLPRRPAASTAGTPRRPRRSTTCPFDPPPPRRGGPPAARWVQPRAGGRGRPRRVDRRRRPAPPVLPRRAHRQGADEVGRLP